MQKNIMMLSDADKGIGGTLLQLGKGLLIAAFCFFAWLMIQITWQYVPARPEVAFLRIKQEVTDHWYYNLAFFTHVYSSIFVLLTGFIQFFPAVRRRYPRVHKISGRIYVALILLLAGPSGLLMGYYGNGGPVAQVAFCLLSVCWIAFTYLAFNAAVRGDIKAHKNWMFRSYALTLSAISLRLWKWGIVWALHPRPMEVYRVVAWLGWVGNLLIAEWLLRRRLKKPGAVPSE